MKLFGSDELNYDELTWQPPVEMLEKEVYFVLNDPDNGIVIAKHPNIFIYQQQALDNTQHETFLSAKAAWESIAGGNHVTD